MRGRDEIDNVVATLAEVADHHKRAGIDPLDRSIAVWTAGALLWARGHRSGCGFQEWIDQLRHALASPGHRGRIRP